MSDYYSVSISIYENTMYTSSTLSGNVLSCNSPVTSRQTNSATPSNDREPQHDARPSQTTLSMGVSCGAAAISIYNCGRQSDGQLCVKVRGHASSSSPSYDLSWLPSPGSPALSWVAVRMDAPLFSHPQYRLQQQRDECLVLSYCDSPNYLVSSERVEFCEQQTYVYTSAKLHELLDKLSLWHSSHRYSASAPILIPRTRSLGPLKTIHNTFCVL